MVSVTLKRKLFDKLMGKKLSDKELNEKLPLIKCEADSFTADELQIEVTGDRPDLLSSEGVTRNLKGFLGLEKGLSAFPVEKPAAELTVEKSVETVRPFICCAVVDGITLSGDDIAELMQIQEKLHQSLGRRRKKVAIGVHDFDKIKPPNAYKAVDPKQGTLVPLGFKEKMTLTQVMQKHPKGIDYAFTLEGKERYPVLTDSTGEIFSFPPIINAAKTEVTEKTKRFWLEVDGTNYDACNTALNILCANFADRGAKVHGVTVIYGEGSGHAKGKVITPETKPTQMQITVKQVNQALGISLTGKQIVECLEKQRIGAKADAKGETIECLVPRYRADFLHPVDLIEEVAIGYCFNNFEPKMPTVFTKGSEHPLSARTRFCRDLLVGAGFLEANTQVLTSEEKNSRARAQKPVLSIANPVSADYSAVRSTITPNLLEFLSKNTHSPYPQKVFEVGETIEADDKNEVKTVSYYSVCAANAHAAASLTEAASLAIEVLSKLGIACNLEPLASPQFLEGRAARITSKHDGKEIGFLGEVHPQVLANFGIEMPVVVFEAKIARI